MKYQFSNLFARQKTTRRRPIRPHFDHLEERTVLSANLGLELEATYAIAPDSPDESALVAVTNDSQVSSAIKAPDDDDIPLPNPGPKPDMLTMSVKDASGDTSDTTVFTKGAVLVRYTFRSFQDATATPDIYLDMWHNGQVLQTWGPFTSQSGVTSEQLVTLKDLPDLATGDYTFRARAEGAVSSPVVHSNVRNLHIVAPKMYIGDFEGETFHYDADPSVTGEAAVVMGSGGTDTLSFGVGSTDVAAFNGIPFLNPTSLDLVNRVFPIYRGSVFDSLRLNDGREIYFQGVERLEFTDGYVLNLSVHTNDTSFDEQWNLHVTDVPSAWRFSQGTSDILLVSLDTGLGLSDSGLIRDLSWFRLQVTAEDFEDSDILNLNQKNHGHKAISIMAATANNGRGIAGINWHSQVSVQDVYQSDALHATIQEVMNYAETNDLKVVFQGGIQGENWFTKGGGTKQQLEALFSNYEDNAFFAIAAGNGGTDIDNTDPNSSAVQNQTSGGVARLQTTHGNVMAVGGAFSLKADVHGLTNSAGFFGNSLNYGPSLTLVAPTRIPAVNAFDPPADYPDEPVLDFDGTSAANPHMAGIASLVWSVNTDLTAIEVREILKDTTMDIGALGRDDTFGHGLVNADSAVRRAMALKNNPELAGLYTGADMQDLHWARNHAVIDGNGGVTPTFESPVIQTSPVVATIGETVEVVKSATTTNQSILVSQTWLGGTMTGTTMERMFGTNATNSDSANDEPSYGTGTGQTKDEFAKVIEVVGTSMLEEQVEEERAFSVQENFDLVVSAELMPTKFGVL